MKHIFLLSLLSVSLFVVLAQTTVVFKDSSNFLKNENFGNLLNPTSSLPLLGSRWTDRLDLEFKKKQDKEWAPWRDYAVELVKQTYEKCSNLTSAPLDVSRDNFTGAPDDHPVKMLSQAYTFLDENLPKYGHRKTVLGIIKRELDAVLAFQEWVKSHPSEDVPSTIKEFKNLQAVYKLIYRTKFLVDTEKFSSQFQRVKQLELRIASEI
jgi:hypothetical protein